MKKLICAILAGALCLTALAGCSSNGDNKVYMSTNAGFAPYEYVDGDEIVGIDVDIAKEIAKDMGKELEILNMDFDAALLAVQQGKSDFCAAGVSINEDRDKVMDFSVEYAVSKQVIVVNKETMAVQSPDELTADKVIGCQQGTVADYYITDDLGIEPKRFTQFLQAAEDLKNNKIDCIVMDVLPAEKMVESNPELTIMPEEVFTDRYAIAVKEGNQEILDQINSTLTRLIEEGKVDEFTLNHTTK